MKRWTIITLILMLFFAVAGIIAEAQAPNTTGDAPTRVVTDDEVNAIAKQLYCPVCENTPLDVCPTQACKDWREMIRGQLAQGWSEKQVIDYFADKFGPRVLGSPPTNGFTMLVWALPIVALLAGGFFVWRLLRQWQMQRQNIPEAVADTSAPVISDALLAQIEKDVEARF